MEPMDQSSTDSITESCNWPSRWTDIEKILNRSGPLSTPGFEEGRFSAVQKECNILVIGAGGLGCELLKNLAMMGFINISVIDMDTIDLSNLNRQFLFREKDIGRPKAKVAAEFINNRVPGTKVTPYYAKIEDFDADFYKQFSIIVCGLDAIAPRRWINRLLCSMLDYNDKEELDPESIHPIVDGGTEGFKGNASGVSPTDEVWEIFGKCFTHHTRGVSKPLMLRNEVIAPGMTACIECTLSFYPPAVNFPMCTLAQTPRLPEHCIEYVKLIQWPKDKPFGEIEIDGDNPEHIHWIHEKSLDRAAQFGINGITYRLTQGVVKRIIPAVASTNAVIAAICANEVFKIAYSCYPNLKTYVMFNDTEGIYTDVLEPERLSDCMSCSVKPRTLRFSPSTTLGEVLDFLKDSAQYQMSNPGATTITSEGPKTLYIPGLKSLEDQTKPNLVKTLADLGFIDGQELTVTDKTSPTGFTFKIRYEESQKPSIVQSI